MFLLPLAELEKHLSSEYPNTVFSQLVVPQQSEKKSSMDDHNGKYVQCCGKTCKQGSVEKAAKRVESETKRSSSQGEEQGPTLSLKLMADALDAVVGSDKDKEDAVDAVQKSEHCR